jgi:DNA-binding transcriptional MerR regulator
VRTLKTSEAAAVLNVSPNTLRAWERRFGYPKPQRSKGKHRLYTHGEIAALRDALLEGLSISSAISRARESVAADTHVLVGALVAFELDRADHAMEGALAMRSVERALEEVLLPSMAEMADRHGTDSAPWALAARWALDWMRRAQRLSPAPGRSEVLLIGDATGDELAPDALALRALELCAMRIGMTTVTLPVSGVAGLGDVLHACEPQCVVIAGGGVGNDDVARWAYRVRATAGALPVLLYHRGIDEPARATGARHLSTSPTLASESLLDLLESERSDLLEGVEDAFIALESRRGWETA